MLELQQLDGFNSGLFLVYWLIFTAGRAWNYKLWPFQNGMFNVTEIGKNWKNKKIRKNEILLGIFYSDDLPL